MTSRSELMTAFLERSGWAAASRKVVAGDASNRRYLRLKRDDETAILMDAPSEKGEDVRPFIQIADHLSGLGLSAPLILAKDIAAGFLLLEDLGDSLFARIVAEKPELEDPLYRAATDVLSALHRAPLPDVAAYDVPLMTDMAALAYEWYGAQTTEQDVTAKCEAFKSAFASILAAHTGGPQVLIQRDYHSENLLWLPDRTGVARVGLLDFQDAMSGHPAYDLVSILQDARRDVPEGTEQEMIAHYIAHNDVNEAAFRASYAVLGVQRNLRIIGVFVRLCLVNGKAHYVDMIPRVWGLLQRCLAHPALDPVTAMIATDLPAPTTDILEGIKAKCAAPRHL